MIGTKNKLITYLLEQEENKKFEVKDYKGKRSLNANDYAWALMENIAKSLRTSKDEVYEIMLGRYGTLLKQNEKLIIIPSQQELKSTATLHLKFIGRKEVNEDLVSLYAIVKGSSQYDTKEMSIFIDGIVSEAIEMDIETKTPQELDALKEKWN